MTYNLSSGELSLIKAKAVLLATGGCGRIFRTTSNGFASTGDGLNLAHRAGIPLMDMEFVQFHPPAALVRAFRYLFDSRDEGEKERIALLDNKNGAWGCQTKWM